MTFYGLEELAREAGVRQRTLSSYLARGKCPAPTARLACGPVWAEADVREWLERRDERLKRLAAEGEAAFTEAVEEELAANWDWQTWRGFQASLNTRSGAWKRRHGYTVKGAMRRDAERRVASGEGISPATAEILRRGEWASERLAARMTERGDDGIPF